MKLLSLILASIAFTILLVTLYPFRQKYSYPNALPTPTPTPIIEKWQIYRNDQYGFEFQYPNGPLEISSQKRNDFIYINLFAPNSSNNPLLVTIIPNGNIKTEYSSLLNSVGGVSKLEKTTFLGMSAYKTNFAAVSVLIEKIYVIKTKTLFVIDSNDSNLSSKILSTFKFFTPVKYTCPTVQWVDCMPGPGVQKPQCDSAYLIWAKANCPNFQGAAL